MTDISLFDAIHTQRAIRRFSSEPVADGLIGRMIDAAIRAPSGTNRQPWAFLVISSAALRIFSAGTPVTFSPKVFIPLTRLCRDFCGYCTFRQDPGEAGERLYMTPEEVLEVAQAGQRLGCTEALFTLGERPEARYPEAKEWLAIRG